MAEEEPEKELHEEKIFKKLFRNYWAVATIVLSVLLILLIVVLISGRITGNVIKSDEAGQAVLDFANAQGVQATLIDIKDFGSLYEVLIKVQGQIAPIYITKDGKNLVPSLVPLTGQAINQQPSQTQQPQEIPKSDKPILEAFVSPYCPYGLQYIKALIPVYDLLKNKADINIRYLGVTHLPGVEESETTRQLCILNEYNKDKLFEYLGNLDYSEEGRECYNNYHGINIQTGEAIQTDYKGNKEHFIECINQVIIKIFNKIKIDKNKINNCMETKGEGYYNEALGYSHNQDNSNVRGSPTPKINGVILSGQLAGRSPELIKQAICSAFNEAPNECSTELSEETPAPGISPETSISSGNSGKVC